MLLISKGMYEAYYAPRGLCKIDPIIEASFSANCYYFHLGALKYDGKIIPLKNPQELAKREQKPIFSLESFTLSDRVFSIIGPCSELIGKGLCLRNSPTIDPGFSGSLEMVMENLTDSRVSLEPGMVIGKAVFFDVSETMVNLDELVRAEKQKAVWQARKLAGQKIKEAGIWIEKMIDAEGPKDFKTLRSSEDSAD